MQIRLPHWWHAVRIALAAILFVAFVWFWMVPFVQKLSVTPTMQLQRQGDEFLSQGRLPEAVLSYRQALSADPSNQEARSALSDAYRAQGRLRMAARYAAAGQIPAQETGDWPAIWTYIATDSAPTGGSIVDDLLLALYEDGTAVALRLEDGTTQWTTRLPSTATSAPTADTNFVYAGAQDGKLYALDRQNGAQRWSFATEGPIYAASIISIDGVVYLPSSDGSLYALHSSDGSLLWKFTTRGALHAPVTVSGGRVVFGSHDARVYALDAASGAPVWQDGILTNGAVENQPAVIENRIIIGSGDGRVYALALDSGGQFWRASTPDAVYAAPLVVDDTVYIASSGKTLSAIDLESGQKLWQANLPGSLRNPPALSGSGLYLSVDADPGLFRVDASSGAVTRLGSTGDWVAFGPWIVGERIFLLGKDGAVLAYPLPR